ncbi:MAG: putative exported protein [Betaproteobacteria bacterium]|nr:putative exported protein [Betaproteobacteria bacterium]
MSRTARTGTAFAWLIACGSLAAAAACAQEFPSKPLRLIVPLLPGSGTDVVARTFANAFGQALGRQVVVENKAGAATTLGANFVAKSTPDGYTLLVATTSTLAVLPTVQSTPYDTVKDLAPVAAFSIAPFVLCVSAESRLKTLNDLIAIARAEPGKLTYASSGTGTMTQMAVELVSVVAKINLLHVPYKGVTGAYPDVLGGRIDLIADAPASTLPQIKANKFRALAVTALKRSPMLPEVPTVGEAGLKGAEAEFVTGILVQAGTPPQVIAKLQRAALKVAQGAEFKDFLALQGYEALSANSADFAKHIKDGLAKWAAVVKERNIKVEQ